MTHTLTVGFDGSKPATRALDWAADMAARDGAELRIVSCYTSPGVVDPWLTGVPIDIHKIRIAAEGTMAAQVERLRVTHPDVRVDAQVVWGKAGETLVDHARGSDLLVVGTAGAGEAESWLLGSVAHAAARSSPCPVVVVPDAPPVEPKGRVVVGVDGSPAADLAVDWAVAEADRRDAELVIVHAWQYEYPDERTAPTGRDILRVAAACLLEDSVRRARDVARVPVRGELAEDAPARAIAGASVGADLVVVGTRGRGGLRSTLFGSVAHAVAARSCRPVVVVRDTTSPADHKDRRRP